MKTLVFCTGWADDLGRWNNVYGRWLEHIRTSKLNYDQILIPDDGSQVLPYFPDFSILENIDDLQPKTNAVMYHWSNNLGRPGALNYPGWYRSFMFAATYAQRYGFQKIIHIESDAYLISERIHSFINEFSNGWIAFYCPRHRFPEAGIQIIAGDAIANYIAISQRPYHHFINQCAENYLPFTPNLDFIGDRYGEYLSEAPPDADYAVQVHPGFKFKE